MKQVLLFALCLTLAATLSCGPEVETQSQVLLVISADPAVQAATTRLEVELKSGPVAARDEWQTRTPETFVSFTWPASLALIPSGSANDTGFEVTVTAYAGTKPLVTSRAISGFVAKKSLLLELVLYDECIDYFVCSADQTCKGESGAPVCQSARQDPKKLPEYKGPSSAEDPGKIPGGDGDTPGDGDGDGDASDAGAPDAGEDCSAPGSCVPPGQEDCFNGKDDDDNGKVDCADSACDPVALCVPGDDRGGVLVAAGEDCPPGFTGSETPLFRNPNQGACTGCTCTGTATSCTADVYTYTRGMNSNTEYCDADNSQVGGTYYAISQLFNAWNQPEPDPANPVCPMPLVSEAGGFRVGSIRVTDGTCVGGGTAMPEPPTWQDNAKLCRPKTLGAGCAEHQVCLPRATSQRACGVLEDVTACSAPVDAWYVSYQDGRGCTPCTCEEADCADVRVQMGNDWSCGASNHSAGANEQSCNYQYAPPTYLVGSLPSNACNPPSSTISGTITPTGRMNLCCVDVE